MVAIIAFYISLSLMLGLLLLRFTEERRQVVWFSAFRKKLDALVIRAFVGVESATRTRLRVALKNTFVRIAHGVFYGILVVLRSVERRLEKTLSLIRRAYTHQGKKGARSTYLNRVGRSAKETEEEEK